MPTPRKPSSPSRRRIAALTTASVVSFSLTLLGGGIAVLSGWMPLGRISLGERVDIGSLLFVMPVVALVLAVVFEVTRIAVSSSELPQPRRQEPVRWSPGEREG